MTWVYVALGVSAGVVMGVMIGSVLTKVPDEYVISIDTGALKIQLDLNEDFLAVKTNTGEWVNAEAVRNGRERYFGLPTYALDPGEDASGLNGRRR